jgi:hypothetical protein
MVVGGIATKGGMHMLMTIAIILLALWLLGFIGNIGGGLIHLLLVVALVVFLWDIIASRRHSRV